MSFSDDDLKQLTDRIEYEDADATMTLWELAPLLARLEAAEHSREAWQELYWGKGNKEAEKKCDVADEGWRKAAGK